MLITFCLGIILTSLERYGGSLILVKTAQHVGKKYRTGLYSTNPGHLEEARAFIDSRKDRDKIVVEVLPLTNYVRSAEEHQHHLERYPEDCSYCHIPDEVLNKYRNQ